MRTVFCTSIETLKIAISGALPGDEIVLENGIYQVGDLVIAGKKGSAASPIMIRAAMVGGCTLTGPGSISINNCSFVTLSGFRFEFTLKQPPSGYAKGVRLNGSQCCTVSRNFFQLQDFTTSAHWLLIDGDNSKCNLIDHNEFRHKLSANCFICIYGTQNGAVGMSQGDVIRANYFVDIPYGTRVDGAEAIRIGDSARGPIHAHCVIDGNLFERCNGDLVSDGAEVVSIKSSSNTVCNNTLSNCDGSIVFRHGNRGWAYDNNFINNTGGIRFYGDQQTIVDNYFLDCDGTGVRSPIYIESGKTEDDTGKSTDANRPDWGVVTGNIIVRCVTGIVVGTQNPLPPLHLHITGNTMSQTPINRSGILLPTDVGPFSA